MRVAGVVGEDHLACFRGFGFASEGRVSLGSGGVANGEVSGHLVEVEHGDGNRVGETALHTSTSRWIHGSESSFRNRRSNASDAHQYWVGFRPIWLNAR